MNWPASLAFCGIFALGSPQEQRFEKHPDHITSGIQAEQLRSEGLGITNQKPARKLSLYGVSLIEYFETWRPNPYEDASGYCTIGYGHLIAKQSCLASSSDLSLFSVPLGKMAGEKLLSNDVALASIAVSRNVTVDLNDEQFSALSSFVFNVGAGRFAKSSLLSYINEQKYDAAAKQFSRYIKANGVVVDGLRSRRACEAAYFSGKIPTNGKNKFDSQECSSLGIAPPFDDLIDISVEEE